MTLKMGGLQSILRALKDKPPMAHVGILGSKENREGENSNAKIGAAHEFGTSSLPKRSFLLMPLQSQIQKRINKSVIADKEAFKRIVAEKSMKFVVGQLGVLGVEIVAEAFATGGFGSWPKSNYTNKKVHMTLVETQQLRDSITFEVVGG